MTYDYQKKYICPRLLDYLLIMGTHQPNLNNSVAQTPELLRRYPMKDHKDFPLPPDVVFFCQPEGCYSVGAKRLTLSDGNCFVFTLTDKDSGKTRYGICMSFFRPFKKFQEKKKSEKKIANSDTPSIVKQRRASKEKKNQGKNHTLTSLCFLSHHPFFSSFRECLFILKKIIETSSEHSQTETG